MIHIINGLYLTENGCSIKNRCFCSVHLRQGDMDGACSIYSLMMYLLILKCVRRNQVDDLYNKIKKSPEVESLFHEFFYRQHGLFRDGLKFDKLKGMINRSFGKVVHAEYFAKRDHESEDSLKVQIKKTLDNNTPVMLGIDFKKGGGHAVLAIGYECDEEGLFNIFCLDPGYACNPTSYWNMVISLDMYKGKYKHQCLTDNPYNCPAIEISDLLVIERIKQSNNDRGTATETP